MYLDAVLHDSSQSCDLMVVVILFNIAAAVVVTIAVAILLSVLLHSVALSVIFLLFVFSLLLLLLLLLSRYNTSGTLPWYSLAAVTCTSTLRVWLKTHGLKRTSLSASLTSGLSSVCVDFRVRLLFDGSGASCS